MNFTQLSNEKFYHSILANTILLGVAVKEFKDIFNKNVMADLLREFFPDSKENIEAFELGYYLVDTY